MAVFRRFVLKRRSAAYARAGFGSFQSRFSMSILKFAYFVVGRTAYLVQPKMLLLYNPLREIIRATSWGEGFMALEKELETYKSKLPEFKDSEGKFVLIRGDQVIDIYTSYEDAIKEGYQKFKLEPFLVKQIQAIESGGHSPP